MPVLRAGHRPTPWRGMTAASGLTAPCPSCTLGANSPRRLGGFYQKWGWFGASQHSRCPPGLHTRIVQSKQNNPGLVSCSPEPLPNQGVQPRAQPRGQESRRPANLCSELRRFPQEGGEQPGGSTPGWAPVGLARRVETSQARDTQGSRGSRGEVIAGEHGGLPTSPQPQHRPLGARAGRS